MTLRFSIFFLQLIPLVTGLPGAAQTQVITTDHKTEKSLSGENPCESARSFIIRAGEFTKTAAYATAMTGLNEATSQSPLREYTISFGKDSQGNIIVSAPNAGNKSNGTVAGIRNGFADLHNHPKNTPPSSGDLYGLLMKTIRDGRYGSRYILTASGTVYALVVTDTLAVRTFITNYPPQKAPGYSPLFPDLLLNEYRDLLHGNSLPEEVVMAYMLEKYTTGVVLLKQKSTGEFTLLRTSMVDDGKSKVYVSNNCE